MEDDDKKSMDDDDDEKQEQEQEEVMEGVSFDLVRNLATQVSDPQSGVTLMTLSNGVRVTMKKTEFDKTQCSVCVHASGGIALEKPGKPGDASSGFGSQSLGFGFGVLGFRVQSLCWGLRVQELRIDLENTGSTQHPTPHTLHPTPYTPHPTPYTLHPTPYTLHPPP